MTAKSDFGNLGASLSSIQQNAIDDQIANNSSVQNYNNVTAQLKASIPSGFGEAIFGAYELLGQGKSLISRVSKVVSDVKKAPQAVKDSLVNAKNNLGASFEEAKNVVTGGVEELQQAGNEALAKAKDITNQGLNVAQETTENVLTAGREALGPSNALLNLTQPEIAVPEIAVPELPSFSLPLASKRPTGVSLADTIAPENIRQAGLREIDPEEAFGPIFNPNLRSYVPEISNISSAKTSIVSGLQEEASSGVSNILGAGKGAQQAVATTLANTTAKGGALANEAITDVTNIAGKATSTISDVAGGVVDVAKATATGLAETGAEVASTFLPIVGEVTAIGLGAVQLYEGFKDLFDHPSASKPVTVPMPQIANIAQGFQSGI